MEINYQLFTHPFVPLDVQIEVRITYNAQQASVRLVSLNEHAKERHGNSRCQPVADLDKESSSEGYEPNHRVPLAQPPVFQDGGALEEHAFESYHNDARQHALDTIVI